MEDGPGLGRAVAFGLMASAAFPIGVFIGLFWTPPRKIVAAVIAFGAGVLVCALSFELMEEAFETGTTLSTVAGFMLGALIYVVLDQITDRMAAKSSPKREGTEPFQVDEAAPPPRTDEQATVSGIAVLMGTALDGIPENAAIGVGIAAEEGPGLGIVLLGAVFLSNLPGAMSSTIGMKHEGRSATYILTAWGIVALACVASVIIGFELLTGMPDAFQSALLALAAGGILAMLSDTMFPDAFRTGGPWVAMSTASGFALAFLLSRYAG
ncbi:ZIP family metal transporter [Caenispirillum salinarum]|uniref:ZIP family metal transporter n=1 Tax=Caenispirillum salinarum TaxID=859058 RepID=UPI00384DBC7E